MRYFTAFVMTASLLLVGCGGGDEPAQSQSGDSSSATLPTAIFLEAPPTDDVQTVTSIRGSASEGDEVVLRGVVGGRVDPFVEDRAIMTIVDDSLPKVCGGDNDHCPTPWDYCCAVPETLNASMATVRLVDESGQPFPVTIGKGDRIKPFSTIVVRGKVAPGSGPDNLIVDATQVFVEQG